MQGLNEKLEALLEKRKQNHLFRVLRNDDNLIDFCSNDYLGFARNEELKILAQTMLPSGGNQNNGSTGSRLIRGNTLFAEDLEHYIASYHYAESSLLFNSGYDANIGLFSCLPQRGDTILYDRLIHASIRDGIRLSGVRAYSFDHNCLDGIQRFKTKVTGNVFVAVESVYSMDGDKASLIDIAALCKENGWHLIVDEAHAGGVFGSRGEGLVDKTLAEDCFARVYTYGKAFGAHGASVVGSELLIQYLKNYARSFIYTTALPPHSHVLIKGAYQLLMNTPDIRQILFDNITFFNTHKPDYLNFIPSDSAIQSLIIGGNEQTHRLSLVFNKAGIDVRPILSPTVPEGQERLRICLHTFNTHEEIMRLLDVLNGLPL